MICLLEVRFLGSDSLCHSLYVFFLFAREREGKGCKREIARKVLTIDETFLSDSPILFQFLSRIFFPMRGGQLLYDFLYLLPASLYWKEH